MLMSIVTSLPMFVCLFWACLFCMEYMEGHTGKRLMGWFMAVASSLYLGHCFYFNRVYAILPVSDTVYSFATLAVYPLYYVYLRWVTTACRISWRTFWVLVPAVTVATTVGLSYLLLPAADVQTFLHQYYYGRITPPALWRGCAG